MSYLIQKNIYLIVIFSYTVLLSNKSNKKYMDKSLNLSIIQFCSNLKKLLIIIKNNESEILQNIFNSCQHLESVTIWCGGFYIDEREMLNIVANSSPKNFYKLKIYNDVKSESLPETLESFFISWGKRIPQKSLILIVTGFYENCGLNANEENNTIIETHQNLGTVKVLNELFNTEEYLFDCYI